MARPHKKNAEYFPHFRDFRNNRRCKAIRSKFGPEGYAYLIMLLESLTYSDGFKISNTDLEIELLAGDFDVDSTLLKQLIDYCAELGLLDKENGFIQSPELSASLQPLMEYRKKERDRSIQRKAPKRNSPHAPVPELPL